MRAAVLETCVTSFPLSTFFWISSILRQPRFLLLNERSLQGLARTLVSCKSTKASSFSFRCFLRAGGRVPLLSFNAGARTQPTSSFCVFHKTRPLFFHVLIRNEQLQTSTSVRRNKSVYILRTVSRLGTNKIAKLRKHRT